MNILSCILGHKQFVCPGGAIDSVMNSNAYDQGSIFDQAESIIRYALILFISYQMNLLPNW